MKRIRYILLIVFVAYFSSCSNNEDILTEIGEHREIITDFLSKRAALSTDTSKLEVVNNKIQMNSVRKLRSSLDEDILVADLHPLQIQFEERNSFIVFFTIEDIVVNSIIVSFSFEKRPLDIDSFILDVLDMVDYVKAFSGTVTFFDLNFDLLQFSKFSNGHKTETAVTTKQKSIRRKANQMKRVLTGIW